MEFTITVTLDESTLIDTPAVVGQWMLESALSSWYSYDDEGNFSHTWHEDGSVTISDPDENAELTISPEEFFHWHARYIWLAQIDNYRHDWIEFAFKSSGVTADEYDDNTTDAVLQNLLYSGQVIYG